jgi:hypothetical protein
MGTRQTTIRFAAKTDEQIEQLVPLFGTITNVVQIAIDRLYQTEIGERKMDEMVDDPRMVSDDRTDQVSWFQELAGNIASNLGEGTAEELVGYALSEEGAESWGVELPGWFDDYDRDLLTRFVAEQL